MASRTDHLVSVLIPAYNAERWIREAMLSALVQTWPRIEVVVVDDGSTDRTLAIAQSLRSSNVNVVRQNNAGASAARNRALALAQGTYIQWLDADDLLHPEKVERQLARADDGLTSRTLLTGSWGRFFYRPEKARLVPDCLWQDLRPVDWLVAKFSSNAWMNPAVWLVSRRLIELAGPWDERLSSDDDGEYISRVVAESDHVRFVADATAYYRMGTVGSLSWKMDRRKECLAPLALALTLSIERLRLLEDSERTRAASLHLLQAFSGYFYGARNHPSFLALQALARKLGGDLDAPKVSWKYYPIEKTLGPDATARAMNGWRDAKLLSRRIWDWMLYRLTSRPDSVAVLKSS